MKRIRRSSHEATAIRRAVTKARGNLIRVRYIADSDEETGRFNLQVSNDNMLKLIAEAEAEIARAKKVIEESYKAQLIVQDLREPKNEVEEYEARVQALEAEGITRSDAQGIVDAEMYGKGGQR